MPVFSFTVKINGVIDGHFFPMFPLPCLIVWLSPGNRRQIQPAGEFRVGYATTTIAVTMLGSGVVADDHGW